MAKSYRVIRILLISTFAFLVVPLYGQSQGEYQEQMPAILDLNILLAQPKYRNIHHDSFCRANNERIIGNNAKIDRPSVLGYKELSKGIINIGINNNGATNFRKTPHKARCIKTVSTGREVFRLTAVRASNNNADVKLAFYIRDIDNYYYARLTNTRLEVFRYRKGFKERVYWSYNGGRRIEINVCKLTYMLSVDGRNIQTLTVENDWKHQQYLCGLCFDNTSISFVDDFIVDYPDKYEDAGIDEAIEDNKVISPDFGTYCAESGVCSASRLVTNNSKRSYRFMLKKPTQRQVKTNRDNALHSTIMLDGIKSKGGNNYCANKGGNKPLDSFVFSVDVFFPSTGEERWVLDELYQDLIIQEHHVGYRIPFSPSIAININKGRVYLNTIWMEHIARGTSVNENETKFRRENIARINTDEEEVYLAKKGFGDCRYLPYLEMGKWHNITLYVKLGYNENQQPRTVVYLDSNKVIDWFTPNAYNCQEYGEYLEFGVYKWDWDTQEKRDKTSIRQRVLYFDNVKYYI